MKCFIADAVEHFFCAPSMGAVWQSNGKQNIVRLFSGGIRCDRITWAKGTAGGMVAAAIAAGIGLC